MAIRDPSRWRFVYTVEHFWHGADLLALGDALSVDLPLARLAYQGLAAGLGVPHTEKEA